MRRIAPLLLLVVLAAPAPARADELISLDVTANNVSTFADTVIWSHMDADHKFRLAAKSGNGGVLDLPIPPSDKPYDPDLGPGLAIAAVYSRCTEGQCALYKYEFLTGQEQLVSKVAVRGCSIDSPSFWPNRYVFVRSGPGCSRPGLFVRTLTRPTRRLRPLPKDVRGFETDVRDTLVVWTDPRDNRVRSIRINGRHTRRLFRDSSHLYDVDVAVRSPTLGRRYAYWLDVNQGESGNDASLYRVRPRSGRECARDEREFAEVVPWAPGEIFQDPAFGFSPTSVATSATAMYYTRYGVSRVDPLPTFAAPSPCFVAATSR